MRTDLTRNKMLADLKKKHKHASVASCRENDCGVLVGNGRRYVTFKGERLSKNPVKMCDCVIFMKGGTIILVEIKSRHLDIGSIEEKFTNAGREALGMAEGYGDLGVWCVLVTRKRAKRGAIERLRQRCRPLIGGKRQRVRYAKCDCRLTDVLRQQAPWE